MEPIEEFVVVFNPQIFFSFFGLNYFVSIYFCLRTVSGASQTTQGCLLFPSGHSGDPRKKNKFKNQKNDQKNTTQMRSLL